MTDVPPSGTVPPSNGGNAIPPRSPFPGTRLLYSIVYAIVAWIVFQIILVVAAIQFVVILIEGRSSEDLKSFSASLVQYLGDLLAFITFVRDDQPFPFGPFPRTTHT